MANLITTTKTYATYDNAVKRLIDCGIRLNDARWLISVHPDSRRFVPTLVGVEYAPYAGLGIMVVA